MNQHNTMLTCLSEQSVYTPNKYIQLVRGCPLIPPINTNRKEKHYENNFNINSSIYYRRFFRHCYYVFSSNQSCKR